MDKQGVDTSMVTSKGQIMVNTALEGTKWSDMFKGEESGNAALDLNKIQMFYFTLILVLACAVAPGTAFAGTAERIAEFPALDAGMVALMGISHLFRSTDAGANWLDASG